jgi:Sulfotransferase family
MSGLSAPHFVGVGSARCGTTWVFKMLRLHPQVWLPWKEMHYFDSVDPETDTGYDIRNKAFRFRFSWRYALSRLASNTIPGASAITRRWFPLYSVHAPGYRWTARYLFGDATDEWYENLFREGEQAGLRCGEITPGYFLLSPAGIERFARVLPNARAFLLLRDPIAWAWSDLCKRVIDRGDDPAKLPTEELIARCAVPRGRTWADLGSNLSRWLRHFPRERLFIGFYDDIRSAPEPFFDRLCGFIGIDPLPEHQRGFFKERINSSARGMSMPAPVKRYAAENYRGEAEMMAKLVGGPAERWLANVESVLKESRS